MTIGSKVKIKKYAIEAFVGQTGYVESQAPDSNGSTVYKVRVGEMIVPGWFYEDDLTVLRRPYTTLVFDIDGTLSDCSEGIMRSAEHALHLHGIDIDWQQLGALAGPPIEESFRQGWGFEGEKLQKVLEDYRERYFRRGIYERRLYPGIYSLLERLRHEGFRIAVVSTRSRDLTEIVLQMLNIRKFVDVIASKEENGLLRTKADILNSLVQTMGLGNARNSFVMVGDRRFDAEAASQAGIDCIGVLWGYGSGEELQLSGAKVVVSTLDALYNLL